MTDILNVAGLTKCFDGFTLNNISFRLQPGYIMGLVGPNGSGKTTTIKLIMNMMKKDKGAININGYDSVKGEVEAKELIGYVSDECMFVEDWKTDDVKKTLALYYKKFDETQFERYIDDFDLPRGRKIKDFSKGMKTKLMLAAALSHDTKLLLLDEPTSGLDPVIRTELLDILQEYIVGGNRSVLFSTHITTDLEKVADYITFINDGNLVFSMDKDSVLETYSVVKGSPESFNSVKEILIGCRTNRMGFEGLVLSENAAKLPREVVCEKATLDDIIVYHRLGIRPWAL